MPVIWYHYIAHCLIYGTKGKLGKQGSSSHRLQYNVKKILFCFVCLVLVALINWPLGGLNEIVDKQISSLFPWLMAELSLVKLPSGECHWTLLMTTQHWFRWWLGAIRQEAITWANVNPDRFISSYGFSRLWVDTTDYCTLTHRISDCSYNHWNTVKPLV